VKKKFTIKIKQEKKTFFAFCEEIPDAAAEAESINAVLEKIKKIIEKKRDGGSDDGTSPQRAPKPTVPHGPTTLVERIELPD
jgi:predicted RNase H-like HicB family nuclease